MSGTYIGQLFVLLKTLTESKAGTFVESIVISVKLIQELKQLFLISVIVSGNYNFVILLHAKKAEDNEVIPFGTISSVNSSPLRYKYPPFANGFDL